MTATEKSQPPTAPAWTPILSGDDIQFARHPGATISRPRVQVLGIHPDGHRIRFTLPMTSDYTEHLSFTVEVFSAETYSWNLLWTIPGVTYRYDSSRPDERNSSTETIARPVHWGDRHEQATSWQTIINALATHAERILPPRDR